MKALNQGTKSANKGSQFTMCKCSWLASHAACDGWILKDIMQEVPVIYYSSQKVWFNTQIFSDRVF
jgi:hypothetical protein